jgi:hypothetical protein
VRSAREVRGIRAFLRSLEGRDRVLVPCPIRTFFGIRCPGCGMTHAVLALLLGDPFRAYRHNPFVFVFIPLLIWGVADVVRRLPDAWRAFSTVLPPKRWPLQ